MPIKSLLAAAGLGAAAVAAPAAADRIEEPAHTVLVSEDGFEIRDYAPRLLAEVTVTASAERAGNSAFNALFGYISGQNAARADIAMTAPVARSQSGVKIPMTAPVARTPAGDNAWTVSFYIAPPWSLETAPEPLNPAVTLREAPAVRMAVVRFNGSMNRRAGAMSEALAAEIAERGLTIVGPVEFAGYDAPFTPGRFRRNEIMVPIAVDDEPV